MGNLDGNSLLRQIEVERAPRCVRIGWSGTDWLVGAKLVPDEAGAAFSAFHRYDALPGEFSLVIFSHLMGFGQQRQPVPFKT